MYVSLPLSIIDVDECAQGKAECQNFCNNTDGSYFCFCKDGFTLDSDGKHCLRKWYTYVCTCVCTQLLCLVKGQVWQFLILGIIMKI